MLNLTSSKCTPPFEDRKGLGARIKPVNPVHLFGGHGQRRVLNQEPFPWVDDRTTRKDPRYRYCSINARQIFFCLL